MHALYEAFLFKFEKSKGRKLSGKNAVKCKIAKEISWSTCTCTCMAIVSIHAILLYVINAVTMFQYYAITYVYA